VPFLAADLTYTGGKFERGIAVEYDEASGRITRVIPAASASGALRLSNRALMPGFVNVHSHSFQRAIRGKTQWRPVNSQPSNFWSWRETMYQAVLTMSLKDVFEISRVCFLEMLKAGYTTVGEFHYLQRDEDGKAYANPLELHEAVLAAAHAVGIRIVLINTAYATGGVGLPLRPEQRRFNTPDLDEFLNQCDQLRSLVGKMPNTTMGIAPHSVRAVVRDWLKPIHGWGEKADVPVHMHVSEQIGEVEACAAAYGRRPVELLFDAGVLDARFTAVHATHIAMNETALLARARTTVCACPTTERDLGDGFLQATSLHAAGVRIAIGTDSQSVIDPLEEVRLIEYHERLRRNERVLMSEARDDRASVAPALLRYGTVDGARALKVDAGEIAEGKLADLIAIDLEQIQLHGWTDDTLDAMLALSASGPLVVTDTWVGGKRAVKHE
jgi:formimidoylglutamate deiminase